MEVLLARNSVSITELKKSPSSVIEQANGEPVAILNRNKPEAYLIPASLFEMMMEWIEDAELAEIVRQRENSKGIKVSLDDL
ncbi:MAG: type II toxin-antitoxin system prevent-host-death family antitoxin [Gammaproteobacteria bacterium]|nr:type II toxin-antitoxin system prevent-host-death family antitoxin [Gammaproteobacteria bacterium]